MGNLPIDSMADLFDRSAELRLRRRRAGDLLEAHGGLAHSHAALRELWLDGNHLRGTLPADLARRFPRLRSLDLHDNALVGPVPDVGQLRLDRFQLAANGFSGVPRVVSQFIKVAEAPWSGAEWAVPPRFDNPRAPVPVLLLG